MDPIVLTGGVSSHSVEVSGLGRHVDPVLQSVAAACHKPIFDVHYRDLSKTRIGYIAEMLSGVRRVNGTRGEDRLGARVDVSA